MIQLIVEEAFHPGNLFASSFGFCFQCHGVWALAPWELIILILPKPGLRSRAPSKLDLQVEVMLHDPTIAHLALCSWRRYRDASHVAKVAKAA